MSESGENIAEMRRLLDEANIKLRSFDLVGDALKAKPVENKYVQQFENLVWNDFKKFCDTYSHLKLNQMEDLSELDKILKEMKLISNCPELHGRNIGAIGGGFSSGKSSFINSFLSGSQIRLAEGIMPVTAIPSYVVCEKENFGIHGITDKGGRFQISNEMYKSISHKLLKNLNFDLKRLILYTTILCPMKSELFENLCLIDTPGYDPPSAGSTDSDFSVAKNYIKDARFLIWMIGLDANGTIPQSDLKFLQELPFGQEDGYLLYIVANKAELKKEDDLDDILEDIQDHLDDVDIKCAGICAYSSKQKKVYASIGQDITSFIKSQNIATRKYIQLIAPLLSVFERYKQAVKKDFSETKEKYAKVHSVLLNVIQNSSMEDDESEDIQSSLREIKSYFKPKDLDSELQLLSDLEERFTNCINSFCAEMGIEKVSLKCRKCGKVLNAIQQFCPKCGTPTNENAKQNTCAQCNAELKPGSKFCPKCGAPVNGNPKQNTCAQCNAELEPGSKFCPKCGAPVNGNPKQNTCAQCNAELKPGSKFCPKCGAKVI